jgi:hypothetical protein
VGEQEGGRATEEKGMTGGDSASVGEQGGGRAVDEKNTTTGGDGARGRDGASSPIDTAALMSQLASLALTYRSQAASLQDQVRDERFASFQRMMRAPLLRLLRPPPPLLSRCTALLCTPFSTQTL